MKRRVALFLAIVLWLGVFQTSTVHALEKNKKLDIIELSVPQGSVGGGNYDTPKKIEYDPVRKKLVLVDMEEETDEVTMKWGIGEKDKIKEGLYSLQYYLPKTTGASLVVQADFHVGKEAVDTTVDPVVLKSNSDYVTVQLSILEETTPGTWNQVEKDYYEYKTPPYTNGATGPLKKKVYTTTINRANQLANKEWVGKIEGIGRIEFFIEDNTVFMSVDGVKKGYITPFTLDYTSFDGLEVENDGFSAFKGLETFTIMPTHLLSTEEAKNFPDDPNSTDEDGNAFLDKRMELPSQDVINVMEDEKLGDRPGVVVSFTKPQVVYEGKFMAIDEANRLQNAQAGGTQKEVKTTAELLLTEKFGLDTIVNGRTYSVKFDIEKDAKIDSLTSGKEEGQLVSSADGKRYEIYFATDNQGHDSVHLWDGLKDGMLVSAAMGFSGNYFNGKDNPPVASGQVMASNMGYTYIYYKVEKSSGDTITFTVKPYNINDGRITYNLWYADIGTSGDTKIIERRTYEGKPPAGDIFIATDLVERTSKYWLDIQIAGRENQFSSQKVIYNPKDAPTPAPYPEIVSVENLYVVPHSNTDVNAQRMPEKVGFDLVWTAPEIDDLERYLKDGNSIYYELFLSKQEVGGYVPSKVFRVYKDETAQDDEDNGIKVEAYAGTTDVLKGKYDSQTKTFKIEDVVLKNTGETGWERLVFDPSNYLDQSKYPNNDKTLGKPYVEAVQDLTDYYIPNTFYLQMRSVYEEAGKGSLAPSYPSKAKPITLDVTKEVIPTVTKLNAVETTEDSNYSGRINFNAVDLTDYVKYMLEPAGIRLSESTDIKEKYKRTYEIYLYRGDSENTDIIFDESQLETEQKINLGDAEEYAFDRKAAAGETKKPIDYLRDGKVIKFTKESTKNAIHELETLNIKGLDGNTPYYFQIRVKLDKWKGQTKLESEYSIFSKYVTFTTGTKPTPPTPEEKRPPAPVWKENPEQEENKVILEWIEPKYVEQAEGDIYYEILRSEGSAMDKEYQGRDKSIKTIIDSIVQSTTTKARYKAFTTKDADKEGYKEYYDYQANKWENVTPLQPVEIASIEDNTLLPNTLYYYYIRTIHFVENEEVRSEWVMMPITTDSLGVPTELAVESDKVYKHDTTNTAVISFLAPIPVGATVGDKSKNYDFEIAIKSEKDEKYYLANDSKTDYKARYVTETTDNDEGRRFVYKISGLKHATKYDVKVRIVDYTKGNGKELRSLYSEKLIIRTEFDEEEQEKDDAYNKYLEKYDKEVEKLKNQPYWEVVSSVKEGIYKYRESYIQDEMGVQDTYTLVLEEDATEAYYYLPVSMFELAKKHHTMVQVQIGDYTTHLRPGMLEGNADLAATKERIDSGKAKDYYIGLEITLGQDKGRINGNSIIAPEITLDMEIVYVEEEDFMIEAEIMEELIALIDDGREDLLDDLEKEVNGRHFTEERLDQLISKEIDYIKRKHAEEVEEILDDVHDKTEIIEKIQKPIFVVAAIDTTEVEVYYRSNPWEKIYSFQTKGGIGIDVTKLGSYIFTGRERIEVMLPTIPGADTLITKYQLTDFFTFEAYGLKSYVTKKQLYGAVARMIGAQRGTDYVLALQNRGIQLIMPNNLQQAVKCDETIYVMMQAYEKMYYKPIQSIFITNKQKVQNIGAFQPVYRPYVYAAVELGVIIPEGNKLSPSKIMTTEEVIRMLTKIMPK